MQTLLTTMAGEYPLPALREVPTGAAKKRASGYVPYPRTAGDVDTNAYFSCDPYAPIHEHSTPVFNPEYLVASTDATRSPTGLTCNIERTDASRRHLDYSDRTGGNQGAGNEDVIPLLDLDAVASISCMDGGTTDQAYEAEAYETFLEADSLAQSQEQQRQVKAMEMAGGMTEDTSFPSSLSPVFGNLCISLPFMDSAHEETAEGTTVSRKRKKSFGIDVGGQHELAMGCEVEQASFGVVRFQSCWAPGENVVTHEVTQPAQAEVEIGPPLGGEMEDDANLQPEEGNSGEEEELDHKKPGRGPSVRKVQDKDRRAILNENLKALKPLFTATVQANYKKWTQLEHILGARDTIVETKSNLAKSLAYIKALETQVAALSALPTSILPFLASEPGPFYGGMGYPSLAKHCQNQSELQALAASIPPLMKLLGRLREVKARMPSQLQMQPQPLIQFQGPASVPSRPQLPSQLQMQLQPRRLFQGPAPKPSRPLMPTYEQAPMPTQPELPSQLQMQSQGPAPMPPQPQLPAYAQAQMQPPAMHQLAVPQAAFPPDDMTFSGMAGQMRHGRGGVVPHIQVHTHQELWGGGGMKKHMKSSEDLLEISQDTFLCPANFIVPK